MRGALVTGEIKKSVRENLAVPVSMIAVLIAAGITAAASIENELKTAVISAAGFLELYFLLWITGKV